MNKLVKIAPIIVILAAAGSLFFVFKLDQMKKDHLAKIASLGSEVSATNAKLTSANTNLGATKKTLTTTSNALAQANTDLQATKASLDQKSQEADGLKTQVAERDQQLQARATELAAAKQEVDRMIQSLRETFGNITNPGEIRAKVQAMADENKVLTESLARLRAEIQQLNDKMVDLTTTPANTRGRVADVQDRWGFVVLDIGEQQHVRKNTQFLIYRDKKPIGTVQVLYAGANASIAEILPDYRKGTPRVGDVAVH